jgi:hypothetical protein
MENGNNGNRDDECFNCLFLGMVVALPFLWLNEMSQNSDNGQYHNCCDRTFKCHCCYRTSECIATTCIISCCACFLCCCPDEPN